MEGGEDETEPQPLATELRDDAKKEIQPPPRSLKAHVWKHFGFYRQPGKKELDMTFTVCRHCHAKVKYFGNTSNTRAHLNRYHPELSEEKDDTPTPAAADQRTLHQFTKLPPSSARAKKLTTAIGYFIAKDMQPYRSVEKEGFRFMWKVAEPRYVIPSRAVFTDTVVPRLYRETKEKVGNAVIKAARVALTCDHWTSRATESFATFTAHYITDKWELKSQVLQTRAMHVSHTATNVNETFHAVAREWGLMLSDLVIVTDNAANMIAAMRLDDELTHITCFAHTLNLAAQKALKLPTVARLLGRIRRITGFFHRSTVAADALKASQNEKGISDHSLITDVTTRWNSAHDMVERFLEQLPAVCAALASPDVRRNNSTDSAALTDVEIKHAEEIVMTLRPLKDATNIMSEDSSPTLSVIAPLTAQLIQDTELDLADSPMVRDIKRAVHEDLAPRYSSVKTQNLLHMASALDPRFKALPFLSEEEQQDIHARMIAEAVALEDPGEAEGSPVEPETGQAEGPAPKRRSTSAALVNLLGKTFTEVRAAPKSVSTRAEEEMKKYSEQPALPLTEDPLMWWKSKEKDLPLLAKLAKRILCIPGTSVAAERVFSTAGDVVTAQRSCLLSEHVDQLIFLQKNLQISDYDN
ncbi:E3 SUMO-protein ligase ZBED1-like [Epinephelus lanceolatus]